MAQRRACPRALSLKLAQMIDIPHANGEFGEMQHGSGDSYVGANDGRDHRAFEPRATIVPQ